MPSDIRERFVIALSRLLGENPTEPGSGALTEARICEEWVIDEALAMVVRDETLELDLEKLNKLMLQCGRRIATSHFYEYFFPGVKTIDAFESAVERFRTKAMLLYGNFNFAYKRLATSPLHEFKKLLEPYEPVDPKAYAEREKFEGIQQIPAEDLHLLGYISRGILDNLEVSLEAIRVLLKDTASIGATLTNLGEEKQSKISDVVANHGLEFPKSGCNGLDSATLTTLAGKLDEIVQALKTKTELAIAVGKQNTQRYLSLPYLDVYCATSMRTKEDFLKQREFTEQVFNHDEIKPLKLRYFDPTLSYVDDRVTKGLIECLMLRRTKVTIYNFGTGYTLGKDSELAATLAQGKQVIVFVPPEMAHKVKEFKVDHPLGLQVDVRHGVAHGILVVESADECARMLRKVLLRDLQFTIRHESGNYLLSEVETGSVLRVVSDDPYLTHTFWTYFHRTD